jgi:hypothetical protein
MNFRGQLSFFNNRIRLVLHNSNCGERQTKRCRLERPLTKSSEIYGKTLSATHNYAAAAKQQQQQNEGISTVRLLVTGACTATTEPECERLLGKMITRKIVSEHIENGNHKMKQNVKQKCNVLLGLAAAGISNEKRAIV